jgi:hypothetical protein
MEDLFDRPSADWELCVFRESQPLLLGQEKYIAVEFKQQGLDNSNFWALLISRLVDQSRGTNCIRSMSSSDAESLQEEYAGDGCCQTI